MQRARQARWEVWRVRLLGRPGRHRRGCWRRTQTWRHTCRWELVLIGAGVCCWVVRMLPVYRPAAMAGVAFSTAAVPAR